MRCLAYVACTVACARPSPPVVMNQAAAADAPRSLAGTYRERHSVAMVCETPPAGAELCDELGEDTLRIRELGGGKLQVAIALVRTNAHTCTFEGELVPDQAQRGERRWLFDETGPAVEFPCRVELVETTATLSVTSEGCREYCGARAVLDGQFRYPPASSDPDEPRGELELDP